MEKSILVIIDPQNDFMDIDNAGLPVAGAAEDMRRIAAAIERAGHKLRSIQITLDSHHLYHIAHPLFWMDAQGLPPPPFTAISADDVERGRWRARIPAHRGVALDYVKALDANRRYRLIVWPPHCLIGSWGHNIYPPLFESIRQWESRNVAIAGKMTKGSNWSTEHYSAIKAEVEREDDPSTRLNIDLIRMLRESERVYVCGQASSHCVANTVRDIVENFGTTPLGKLWLIADGMSPVAGFETGSQDFLRDMKARGLNICRAADLN